MDGPEETGTERTARSGGGATRTERFFRPSVVGRGVTAEELLEEADPVVRRVGAADGTRTPPDMGDRVAKHVRGANLLIIDPCIPTRLGGCP